MPPRELQQYQQWVGLLQVQYVPDGRGGFFEIIDSESQGGMFAVSAVAAEHLQQCLEGTAAPSMSPTPCLLMGYKPRTSPSTHFASAVVP